MCDRTFGNSLVVRLCDGHLGKFWKILFVGYLGKSWYLASDCNAYHIIASFLVQSHAILSHLISFYRLSHHVSSHLVMSSCLISSHLNLGGLEKQLGEPPLTKERRASTGRASVAVRRAWEPAGSASKPAGKSGDKD